MPLCAWPGPTGAAQPGPPEAGLDMGPHLRVGVVGRQLLSQLPAVALAAAIVLILLGMRLGAPPCVWGAVRGFGTPGEAAA